MQYRPVHLHCKQLGETPNAGYNTGLCIFTANNWGKLQMLDAIQACASSLQTTGGNSKCWKQYWPVHLHCKQLGETPNAGSNTGLCICTANNWGKLQMLDAIQACASALQTTPAGSLKHHQAVLYYLRSKLTFKF
jgi:D-hexose-6-phosphate mutarotase